MEGRLSLKRYQQNISARCIFMVYIRETEASCHAVLKVTQYMHQSAS